MVSVLLKNLCEDLYLKSINNHFFNLFKTIGGKELRTKNYELTNESLRMHIKETNYFIWNK